MVAQALQDRVLQAHVDRQAQVLARRALLALQLADHAADRVHLHLHRARAPAQLHVLGLLHAVAADADAGQGQHGVFAHVALAGRRHIAHDVGERRALGIEAGGADIHEDAGQVRRVDLDPRHLLPGQELAHDDGDEAAAAAQLAFDAGAFVVGQGDDAGEGVQRVAHVGRLLGRQQRAPVQLVAADDDAGAVQDAPARRGDQAGADPVALRQGRVALPLHDLHLIELGAKEPEDANLAGAQQQRAPGEDAGALVLLLDLAHGRRASPAMAAPSRAGPPGGTA